MSETVTDIVINAPADEVWRVLSDFSAYPEWNPYIRGMSGTLAVDATLTVTRLTSDRGESTSRPTVMLYRPGREFRLRDRPVLPGLLDCEHGLKLEPLGPEQVRFVHWRATSGLLAPMVGVGSGEQVRGQLEAMNLSLKGRVENGTVHDAAPATHTEPASGASAGRRQPVASLRG